MRRAANINSSSSLPPKYCYPVCINTSAKNAIFSGADEGSVMGKLEGLLRSSGISGLFEIKYNFVQNIAPEIEVHDKKSEFLQLIVDIVKRRYELSKDRYHKKLGDTGF